MIFRFSNVSTTTERRRTDEGFLDVPAMIYRSGLYRFKPSELDSPIPENLKSKPEIVLNVPDQAITDPEFLSSARARPVTFGHPDEFVNSKNAIRVSRGTTVGGAKVSRKPEGVYAGIDLRIFDADLIDRIESGEMSEVSIGNSAELEFGAGERDGVKYDGTLDRIRINHIAVVKTGRAGHAVRLANEGEPMKTKVKNVDGAEKDPAQDEPITVPENTPATGEGAETPPKEEPENAPIPEPMETPETEEPEAEPVDVVAALAEIKTMIAGLAEALAALKPAEPMENAPAPEPEAEKDPAAETTPEKIKNEAADVLGLVDRRIAILNAAKHFAPAVEVGSRTNREIMTDVLNAINPGFSTIVAGKLDETIDALFDAAVVAFKVPESVSAGIALVNAAPAPKVDPVDQARRERADREKTEFKKLNGI